MNASSSSRLRRWAHSLAVTVAVLVALGIALGLLPGETTGSSAETLRHPAELAAEMRAPVASPGVPATNRVERRVAVQTVEPARLLVKLTAGGPGLDAEFLASAGLREVRSVPQLRLVVFESASAGPSAEASLRVAAAQLLSMPAVERVESAGVRTASGSPDDPWYAEQWALPRVNLPAAWNLTTGSPEVVIAVLDTGVYRGIPDLEEKIYQPYDMVEHTSDWPYWDDVEGHGSAVASVAAALGNNDEDMAGAAWDVKLMPVHLSDNGSFSEDIEIEGIVWATDHGADVINISAGSPNGSEAEQEAVNYAMDHGVVVVASVGNDGQGYGVRYPAAYPGVIGVGASDMGDSPAAFSNSGSELDLLAPGTGIISYWVDEYSVGKGVFDGTSFASPLVAGVAALMLSVNSDLSPAQVEQILRDTATDLGAPGFDEATGSGLLDALAAVEGALDAPTTTTTTTPEPDFSDVPASHPYAEAISEMASAGVITGFDDGTFRPDDSVWRQQFTKMILLALDQTPTTLDISPFLDVDASLTGLYPDHYIALAHKLGVVKGTSVMPPLFSPYRSIPRAQVITMVVRGIMALRPGLLTMPPTDYRPPFGSSSPEHDPAAAIASYNGLLDALVGVGLGWDPWQEASRGEVAAILAQLL